MMPDRLSEWADQIERHIAREGVRIVDRVIVLAHTASTQDAALGFAAGRPGLLLTTGRQTGGRGRLGRAWEQCDELGLAATFALDPAAAEPAAASLAAGLAVLRACEAVGLERGRFGLRWPNDVVETLSAPGGGRKLAGVLIEQRDGLLLAGVGINVGQEERHFPEALRGRAVSLAQAGLHPTRLEILKALVVELDRLLRTPAGDLAAAWLARDVLVGSEQEFIVGGQRLRGLVESIDPAHEIVVRVDGREGGSVRLPAATTSLVH